MALAPAPERVDSPTTPVRGITSRDLERELANWQCANQEAMGDTPVAIDETLLAAME